jgi:hypothetical protein
VPYVSPTALCAARINLNLFLSLWASVAIASISPPDSIFFKNLATLKLLRSHEGEWPLRGADKNFAQLVFKNNGTLGVSKARRIGDKVHMHSGPLKDMEGKIIRIDKHSRNGQVEFNFDNLVWKVWLAFEYMD